MRTETCWFISCTGLLILTPAWQNGSGVGFPFNDIVECTAPACMTTGSRVRFSGRRPPLFTLFAAHSRQKLIHGDHHNRMELHIWVTAIDGEREINEGIFLDL